MKRYISILVAVLAMFSVLPVSAQQTQDALYIYRNDGGFNAFFFGDIDRIEYSKIDTLGVEQTDYVVQEVYALDTVYRVPISAIDSIAFVTPEKKIKADVFCPDKLIANYIVASDTINWIRLASNTPAAMIPKKGDKLLIEEKSQFIPRGFVGLVTSVDNNNDGYTIMTGELRPTDIYERLVIKAAAASPLPDKVRHRGLFDGTEMSYTTEEPIELPVLSGSISIQGSRVLYDKHDVSLTADATGSFSFSMAPRLQFRGFIFIDPVIGLQQDMKTTIHNKSSYSLSVTGSLTGNVDIPLAGIPDIELPVGLKIAINCGLFINAQLTGITIQKTWESEQIGKGFFYNKLEPPFTSNSEPVAINKITFCKDSTSFSCSMQGKYTFSAGVYAKAEVSATLPFDKDKNKIKDKVGARLEVGARLNFEAPIWTPDIIADLVTSQNLYQLLNKETNISTSAYGKMSVYAQINDEVLNLSPELSTTPAHLFSLVPDISDIRVSYDDPERPYRFKFTSPIRRDVLLGIPTGFVVLDQDKKVIDDWGGGYHFREKPGMTYSHVFTTLDPIRDDYKTYTVYPYIKYMNSQLLVDKSIDVKVDPARIDIEHRKITVSEERGNREIRVQPNMAKVEFTPTASWLETIWIDDKNELTVFWGELPEDMKGRKAKINIKGINSTTNEPIITDTITVVQGEVSDASVEPTLLEFPAEGGVKFAKYTFGDYKSLGRQANASWMTTAWSQFNDYPDEVIVCASPNTTKEARVDTVKMGFTMVKGSPFNERFIIPIVVKQAAGPYNLKNAKSYLVGSWRYKERVGGTYDVDKDYLLTFNPDGTYTEDRKEDGVNYADYKVRGTEEGTYEVTEITHEDNNRIKLKVKMIYKNGSREAEFHVYAHRIFYWQPRLHYYVRE